MISEGSCDAEEMMLKIQLCVTGIKYILNDIQIENSYCKLYIYSKLCLIKKKKTKRKTFEK